MLGLFNFLHKSGTAVAFIFALLIALISVFVISNNSIKYDKAYADASKLDKVVKITDPEEKNEEVRKEAYKILSTNDIESVGFLVSSGIILTVLGLLIALFFPLIKSLSSPKSLLIVGVGMGLLLFVFFLAYGMSSTNVMNVSPDNYTSGESKFSGAIVGSIFVFVGLAIVGMVGGEVYRIVKERN